VKLEPYLWPCTKINSKWINEMLNSSTITHNLQTNFKVLNVRPEILKFLEENIGETLRRHS
jgi:hypothetical protein